MKQYYPIHTLYLWDATDNLLWHQKLGRPCNKYLYNAHKYIYGVPKFSDTISKVLYQCPTFIQVKMSKNTPGYGTTHVSTQPYQGLFIGFDFSAMTSDDRD